MSNATSLLFIYNCILLCSKRIYVSLRDHQFLKTIHIVYLEKPQWKKGTWSELQYFYKEFVFKAKIIKIKEFKDIYGMWSLYRILSAADF